MSDKSSLGCGAKILLLLMGGIFALLLMEIGLRLFDPQLTYGRAQALSLDFYAESEWTPFQLQPNFDGVSNSYEGDHWQAFSIKTNEAGFRGDSFSVEKPEDEYRIMAVGDSFTLGVSVNDGEEYPLLLEQCLNAEATMHHEVINAGYMVGYSPDSFYVYLREIAPQYEPDMVLVNYFVGNDFLDMLDTEYIGILENGLPERVKSASRFVDVSGQFRYENTLPRYTYPLLRNLHLYQFLLEQADAYFQFSRDILPEYINRPELYTDIYQANYDDELEGLLQESLRMLGAMHALSQADGYDLRVILIPSGVQTHQAFWEEEFSLTFPTVAGSYPQVYIRDYLESESIPYLDLLPAFREVNSTDLYQHRFGHWTAAGSQLAANSICKYINEGK